jgi:hypothetical protein
VQAQKPTIIWQPQTVHHLRHFDNGTLLKTGQAQVAKEFFALS